jgi:para-nitrobenzyl esterase
MGEGDKVSLYSHRSRRTFTKGLVSAALMAGCVLSAESGEPRQDLIVETNAGAVRGGRRNAISSFKGIPYGLSPGGANRFLPPRPRPAWSGVRDARDYGPMCPQPIAPIPPQWQGILNYHEPTAPGDDCLVLNVWTTGVRDGAKRAVLFWCHGGGFASGSGSAALYDGEKLARQGDVVVVTVNHRLGPLGYLYLAELGDERFADSGNVGMLDLVLALKWVRDNIAAFGGNPDRVMIFGQSGGGAKVRMLMGMPAAQGLFSHAVIQSSPGLHVLTKAEGSQFAERVVSNLKIRTRDIQAVQEVALENLFAANAKAAKDLGLNSLMMPSPVVDGRSLPAPPYDPAPPTCSSHVPLMIGSTKDEILLFEFMSGKNDFGSISQEESERRTADLLGPTANQTLRAYRTLLPSATAWGIYERAASAAFSWRDSLLIAQRKANQHAAAVFMYRLDWESPVAGGRLRAFHGIDQALVFNNIALSPGWTGTGAAALGLAAKMSAAWIAFAKTGIPNVNSLPHWPAYTLAQRETMLFDDPCSVQSDPDRLARLALTAGAY